MKKPSQINLRHGGELLILANHIAKQLSTDDVDIRLLTLLVCQTRELFDLL